MLRNLLLPRETKEIHVHASDNTQLGLSCQEITLASPINAVAMRDSIVNENTDVVVITRRG